jgi:hypothetical protein
LRIVRIILLLLLIGLVAIIVESVFRFTGLRYSLTDSRGLGKIAVFVLVLPAVLLFTRYVAGVSALRFIARYMT